MGGVLAGGDGTGTGAGNGGLFVRLRVRDVHQEAFRDADCRDAVGEREPRPHTFCARRAFADAHRTFGFRSGRGLRAADEEARTAEVAGDTAPARQQRAGRKARRRGAAEPEPWHEPAARAAASDADPRVERRGMAAR
ncbi:hypothetical protein [Streptomyces sp. NBC_01320]|uniref:hypothetical protein n=1 Tax=Streptomyces sp. NBC_01320 TaxID=2903824 RepID=UPI002E12DB44|nr:hypothetical protein OG395_16385 [Streptomyces sp. NBC_01320]